jgi:hypothetical protein
MGKGILLWLIGVPIPVIVIFTGGSIGEAYSRLDEKPSEGERLCGERRQRQSAVIASRFFVNQERSCCQPSRGTGGLGSRS